MKYSISIVLLICVVACASAIAPSRFPNPRQEPWPPRTLGPTFPLPPLPKGHPGQHRYARETNPQKNILSLEGVQPLSGPDRKPSINLNYNHRVFEDNRGHVDTYGGANWSPHKLTPHAGVNFERNYKNGFVRGFGQVQPGPRGHMDPSFGLGAGFRF